MAEETTGGTTWSGGTFDDLRLAGRDVGKEVETEESAITQLANELKVGRKRVFFYAASGFDWQPLHRFTHLCDCFVYVDPRLQQPSASTTLELNRLGLGTTAVGENLAVEQFIDGQDAYNMLTQITGPLAEMKDEPWARTPGLMTRPPWGAVVKLRRRVGSKRRSIWLLIIAGSPLATYRTLFINTRTAPECLTLIYPRFENPEDQVAEIVDNLWNQFAAWDGEVGAFLRDNRAAMPKMVAGQAPFMPWPVLSLRSLYSVRRWVRGAWTTDIHSNADFRWPELSATATPGRRRVIVTRKPLNPHSAAESGTFVIPHEKYHAYQWPDRALAVLGEPPPYPNLAVPDGPTVAHLDISGVPLLEALGRLDHFCVERRISKVAVQGLPGFEDEADALDVWRGQDGPVKELILHMECDGHFIDFAPAADEID